MNTKTKTEFTESVHQYWNSSPNGTTLTQAPPGSPEFYRQIEDVRYAREPEIFSVAQFTRWRGKRVLEIGCGVGTDLAQFARADAHAVGIDLTPQSARLANARLRQEHLSGEVYRANAERLPFADATFDLVYSWGVLHHAEFPERAIAELRRVLRPGAEARIMLYNRRSWCVLWLLLGRVGKPGWPNPKELLSRYMESPGTRAYTSEEIRELFREFTDVSVEPLFTHYDLPRQFPFNRLVPAGLVRAVGRPFGWFFAIRAVRPA